VTATARPSSDGRGSRHPEVTITEPILAHHEQDIVMFGIPPPLRSRGRPRTPA